MGHASMPTKHQGEQSLPHRSLSVVAVAAVAATLASSSRLPFCPPAIEKAKKQAVTDGKKRCLRYARGASAPAGTAPRLRRRAHPFLPLCCRTYGNSLGLCLRDDDYVKFIKKDQNKRRVSAGPNDVALALCLERWSAGIACLLLSLLLRLYCAAVAPPCASSTPQSRHSHCAQEPATYDNVRRRDYDVHSPKAPKLMPEVTASPLPSTGEREPRGIGAWPLFTRWPPLTPLPPPFSLTRAPGQAGPLLTSARTVMAAQASSASAAAATRVRLLSASAQARLAVRLPLTPIRSHLQPSEAAGRVLAQKQAASTPLPAAQSAAKPSSAAATAAAVQEENLTDDEIGASAGRARCRLGLPRPLHPMASHARVFLGACSSQTMPCWTRLTPLRSDAVRPASICDAVRPASICAAPHEHQIRAALCSLAQTAHDI